MVRLDIRLLGRPAVLRDGAAVADPRGSKPWALLAYLALSERPRTRPELAALLFGEADDPLGALRWNLAALRRLLGLPESLRGQQLTLGLPDGATVDVHLVDEGDPVALGLPELGEDLLATLSFPDSPGFEAWLLHERTRLRRLSTSLLRNEALAFVGRGEHEDARRCATRLVLIEPLDEGHQALLIRTHALAGATGAAREQYERCCRLLRQELGVEPGPAVLAAAREARTDRLERDARLPDAAELEARWIVAWRSYLAGSVDHGIGLARETIELADRAGALDVSLTARLYLGSMLGMAARGWDEAATRQSEALHLAEQLGDPDSAAFAHGAIAGNELMRADQRAALLHARAGLGLSDVPLPRAHNLVFLGAAEAELARIDDAIAHVREAVVLARRGDAAPNLTAWQMAAAPELAWTAAHAARVLLSSGALEEAGDLALVAAEAAGAAPAQLPWPLALLAEVRLGQDDLDGAAGLAQQALGIALTTGISWQQAVARRAVALAMARGGAADEAIALLQLALDDARRPGTEGYVFHWPVLLVLESLAELTSGTSGSDAHHWARELHRTAHAAGVVAHAERADRLLAVSERR